MAPFCCEGLKRKPRESHWFGGFPLILRQARVCIILGVDSPFFATIVLFKQGLFPLGFDGFLKRRIPGKNGEGTPRIMFIKPRKVRKHFLANSAGQLIQTALASRWHLNNPPWRGRIWRPQKGACGPKVLGARENSLTCRVLFFGLESFFGLEHCCGKLSVFKPCLPNALDRT